MKRGADDLKAEAIRRLRPNVNFLSLMERLLYFQIMMQKQFLLLN